jgi:uncharacterized protein YecT (DUF1311 family)
VKRLTLALLLAGAACAQEQAAPPRLPQVEQECGYTRKQFLEAWPCISVGYAYPDDDLRKAYIAKGNHVAEEVREGRMSEMEARAIMAEAYQQAVTTYQRRQAAGVAASAPVEAPIIGGRQTYQPAPVRQPINCVTVGTFVSCY